jgi:hypothetical protein
MRVWVCALGLVLSASLAFAQTTTANLVWDVDAPVATVNGYTRSITVDGVAVTAAPACVAATAPTTGTTCSVPVAGLQTGTHAVVIKYTSGSQSVQNTTTGLSASGTLPALPANLRITVTVTVVAP